MSNNSLSFSNVTFAFDRRKVLFKNVSCSLSNNGSGWIVALMGPSGVGKTTFCDLALGVRRPQGGYVKLEPSNANLAIIPQRAVIFDELSVRENISCLKFSKTLGSTFCGDRVNEAMRALGLSEVVALGTAPAALSGGEAQRVMLGRIQTIRCDILVLDEPCSFLDNRVKQSFLSALRATVDASKILALFVTHVWDEARFVADQVLLFTQMPGRAATLRLSSIREAETYPPDLDSLFAIYWPNCAVLAVSELSSFGEMPSRAVPPGAAFVGLVRGREGGERNEWASKLWAKIHKGNGLATSRADILDNGKKDSGTVALFYDDQGVVIRT